MLGYVSGCVKRVGCSKGMAGLAVAPSSNRGKRCSSGATRVETFTPESQTKGSFRDGVGRR